MELFLQQLANGLVIGSTYAVVAIGFALAFTVLRVINFAHPDIFMVGMFAGLAAAAQWPMIGLAGVLVAGNRYFEGVMVVALCFGIVEALVTGYLSSSLRDAAAFFILIGVLYFRPNGLFGSYAT